MNLKNIFDMEPNEFNELKKFILDCEQKNQQKHNEAIQSWKNLFEKIVDEIYCTEKQLTIDRLKVLQVQTNDFLMAIRDTMQKIRKPESYISETFLKTEKEYIKSFENLQTIIQQKIDLRLKKENEKQLQQEPETPEPENKFLNIFKEGGYELFCYLNEKYTLHDKKLPTKYSNLYRFLDYEQFIVCTQDQYREFIQSEFGVKKFSKVTKGNYRYEDNVFNSLTRFKSQYKNQLKST